ncbi:MAG: DUF5678 domain-containing protein [Blastocatellia bacterium]
MSSVTVESILSQINQLPLSEREQLRAILADQPQSSAESLKNPDAPSTPVKPLFPSKDRTREFQWLAEHQREYIGQWIALEGDRLIAHSHKADEVFATVKAAGIDRPLICLVEDPDLPFIGL